MKKKSVRKSMICAFLSVVFLIGLLSFASADGPVLIDIPKGCYAFATRLDHTEFLDVNGGGTENGTNIQIWDQNDGQAQMFYIFPVGGGWFGILNINSRKAVDVAGGQRGNSVNVQLYDWNGTDAQLWQAEAAPEGGCFLRNKLGYYLDVSGGNVARGTNVQVYDWNGSDAQIWDIIPVSGLYTLTTALNRGMRIDVNGNNDKNGTNIQIWTANGSGAQIFCLVKRYGEWFSIHHSPSRKVLDVAGGVSADGINVQLYDWNETDAQLWRFVPTGNGSYYIQNKLGYYLDVSLSGTADGTNVQVCRLNRSSAQQWWVEPADLTREIIAKVTVSLHFDNFSNMNEIEKLAYIWSYFNHGAKYDIKRKECWNALFNNIAFPGTDGVILCGELITPEQLGNIIYGYTGKRLGYSDTLIYQGGGFAASGPWHIFDESAYYGDSAIDHKFISIGIELAR